LEALSDSRLPASVEAFYSYKCNKTANMWLICGIFTHGMYAFYICCIDCCNIFLGVKSMIQYKDD
jgi:hypothetical protein